MYTTNTQSLFVGTGGDYSDWNTAASALGTTGGTIILLDSVMEVTEGWEGVKLNGTFSVMTGYSGVPTRSNIRTISARGKTIVRAKGGSNVRALLCNTFAPDGTTTGSGGNSTKRNTNMYFEGIEFDMNYPNNAPWAISGAQYLASAIIDGFSQSKFVKCGFINCRVASPSGTAYGIGVDTFDAYDLVMEDCYADNCDKNLWLTTNAPGDKINGRIRNFKTTNSIAEGVYLEAGVGWDIEVFGQNIGTHFIYMPTTFTSATSWQFRIKGKCDGYNGFGFVNHCPDGYVDLILYNNSDTALGYNVQIEATNIRGSIEMANYTKHGVRLSNGSNHQFQVKSKNGGTATNNTYNAVQIEWATNCTIDCNDFSTVSNKPAYAVNENSGNYNNIRAVSSTAVSGKANVTGANSVNLS